MKKSQAQVSFDRFFKDPSTDAYALFRYSNCSLDIKKVDIKYKIGVYTITFNDGSRLVNTRGVYSVASDPK